MDILPKGAEAEPQAVGGSPRGASFLNATACWYAWALKYLAGYLPLAHADYFDLGSAYHALMEGQSADAVRSMFPEQLEDAALLHARRIKGPPLGNAVAKEKEVVLFDGLLTSKPDRVEKGADGRPFARDYKTAAHFSKHDEKSWGVDVGILGEIASTAKVKNPETLDGELQLPHHGIVDIISKSATTAPFVKLVRVELTLEKYAALEHYVRDVWSKLTLKLTVLAKFGKKADPRDGAKVFPRNLSKCMGEYGPCPYYAHCWGKLPESAMFKFAKEPPRRWTGRVSDEKGSPLRKDLPLPKGLTLKVIDQAAANFKKWVKS